jgi:hypothetical protein
VAIVIRCDKCGSESPDRAMWIKVSYQSVYSGPIYFGSSLNPLPINEEQHMCSAKCLEAYARDRVIKQELKDRQEDEDERNP